MTKPFLLILITSISFVFINCDTTSSNNDVDDNNSFKPDGMVLIEMKNQSFSMGSDHRTSEQPIHDVSFTYNIFMDTTEVIQKEYDNLMSQYYDDYSTPNWLEPYGIGKNYAVYNIYWEDAILYCNAKSKHDGLDTVYSYSAILGTPGWLCNLSDAKSDLSKNGYRLPTEAEWEFACRAGSTTDYYWGKNIDQYSDSEENNSEICKYAIWVKNSFDLGSDTSAFGVQEVAQKLPNAFGLYDMTGNVYEWCHDYWEDNYSNSGSIDPSGPSEGTDHCIRGGSWGNSVDYLRSSNRMFSAPAYLFYFLGFRTVLSAN